jgi:pilus assembly protein CpaB
VVIAQQDIPARTEIGPEMLSVVDVPGSLAVNGALESVEPLIGETTRYPVAAGQQVTLAGVGTQSKEDGLESVVPKGMRALSVEVDEISGVGGLLLPGDRVDVIAVLTAEAVGVDSAVTVLQGIEVLAVAQKTQEPLPAAEGDSAAEPGPSASGQRPADAEPQPEARTVTLALTPTQAQLLALIQEQGKIWLSLRPFGEDGQVQLTESTIGVVAGP